MNQFSLEKALAGLPLGLLRYIERVGSTNDEARRWMDQGAQDLSLVVADEQTAGRGRGGRTWFTPAGSALAFSLVLRTPFSDQSQISTPESFFLPRLTGLGALAVCEALRQNYHLPALIKWPNDVLIQSRKVAGVLVEALWEGDRISAAILGIGVNVTPTSIPPSEKLDFPATCVETALGQPISRLNLLSDILTRIIYWRERIGKAEFILAWEALLALRNERVWVVSSSDDKTYPVCSGQVLGLDTQGYLRLCDERGEILTLHHGEVSLRPTKGLFQEDRSQEN